jgi:Cu2+-exporting ATPase
MHFQELLSAAGNYSIKVFNPNDALLPTEEVTIAPPKNAAGKYYCPMFCEDDKVYDEGDCPVCGMDLVQAPDLTPAKTMYTCPMHPEIIQEGRAPTCGMDLVPMEPRSEDNKRFLTYA